MEETLAFGDHFNDLSMLEAAGVGVAMGNAPQAVREAADAVRRITITMEFRSIWSVSFFRKQGRKKHDKIDCL